KIIHVEALYQCLRAFIRVGVQALVRMSVSREERFQPKHVGVLRAADDNGAYAGFDESDTAKDQSAHDPLAQFSLFHHQIANPLRRYGERLHRILSVNIYER